MKIPFSFPSSKDLGPTFTHLLYKKDISKYVFKLGTVPILKEIK